MPHRTLVTGFTAFGRFAENPSALLAASCGRPFVLLEVAYAAVDGFVDTLDPASFDGLLMLGVAGSSDMFRVERVARNLVGATPDVRGVVPGIGPIDPTAPPTQTATLWPETLPPRGTTFSDDAGAYLCNYLAFRTLRRFAGKPVGFLHVPPVEVVPIERQQATLAVVLGWVEA